MQTRNVDRTEYAAPIISDYGDLIELTQATGFTGPEDGGSKLAIHHESPNSSPTGP